VRQGRFGLASPGLRAMAQDSNDVAVDVSTDGASVDVETTSI
jgi:hypothetical protein